MLDVVLHAPLDADAALMDGPCAFCGVTPADGVWRDDDGHGAPVMDSAVACCLDCAVGLAIGATMVALDAVTGAALIA